jgi:outer membrane protein
MKSDSFVIRALCATALIAAASPAILAQEGPKVGFVSTERLLRDAVPAKAAQQKLQVEFSKREKEMQEMAARLKQLTEKFDRDAPVLTESDRVRRQREIADLEKDFQRRQREFREDLNQRRNEELAQVVERANRVIRQIAEKERFDFILQEAVYVSPRVDITERVLKALSDPSAGK